MIVDDIVKHGNVLFRYRSFLPFLLAPLGVYYFYQLYLQERFPEASEEYFQYVCVAVSMAGLILRAFTVGFTPRDTSGRNTREQKAEVLNTTGMYSIVCHPLYLANYVLVAGFIMSFESLSFFLIATLMFFIYYERIAAAEEHFLLGKFGEDYRKWREKTPAFFPNPFLWRSPARSFSFRKVLRREGPGLMLVGTYFLAFEAIEDVVLGHEAFIAWLRQEPQWLGLFLFGTGAYALLKLLRKKTTLLVTAL